MRPPAALHPTPGSVAAAGAERWACALCAGLAASAALIHVHAAVDHTGQGWDYVAFFALLAAGQLAWSAAALRAPSGAVLRWGARASMAIAALWCLSRGTGLPVGTAPWRPEGVGLMDSLATADEVLLAHLALAVLAGRPPRLTGWAGSLAAGLVAVSLVAFLCGAHAG